MLGGICIVRKKTVAKQVKVKFQNHTQRSAFSTVSKFPAEYKKWGKFIRKYLVTVPILKGYMVPEAQKLQCVHIFGFYGKE